MTTETCQKVTSCSIQQVDHKVFASTQNSISFWVPVYKINIIVFARAIFQLCFKLKLIILCHRIFVFFNLPDSQNIVHATCDTQRSIKIKLDELYGFCMAFKFTCCNTFISLFCRSFSRHLWSDCPYEALVVAITTKECVEWDFWQLRHTINMILMYKT